MFTLTVQIVRIKVFSRVSNFNRNGYFFILVIVLVGFIVITINPDNTIARLVTIN